ncbi:1-acyl-sn-glycerol-3-phosphate acyltransferase [Pikeienuella piscinae]|uniref:1-acyl-sn-glycerol-3-phosphate acyltransferase n=1 Tax=Pikeienuella piscinae TaxID=2748098 RepID=A0A7L5BU25_9RHOB|nr:lysophospholipid acyltransferase family protein [Pikeienuella piscinae]QIE54681.1 1-acyl-sn-glycerol-3-phosphate acyltransferase [Pikeienuella piscinae]
METPTWKEAEPPALPAPTVIQKLRGGIRIAAALLVTGVLLLVFVIGKGLKSLLGPWVTFQYLAARVWSRAMLTIFGMRPVVRGKPIRRGGVLVANHASWIDILALRSTTRINFVSKAEVRDWPGVGAVAALCETVFIERRRTAAKRQQAELQQRMLADELLCIFPEGTSTDGLRVLPFKSALMSVLFTEGVHENALVQPVSLIYRPAPRLSLPVNFYGWWGSMKFESHVWQVAMRSRGGVAEIVFHDAVRAADWPDRKALTQHCEQAVRSAFFSNRIEQG